MNITESSKRYMEYPNIIFQLISIFTACPLRTTCAFRGPWVGSQTLCLCGSTPSLNIIEKIILNNCVGIKKNILLYIKTFSLTQKFIFFPSDLKRNEKFFLGPKSLMGPEGSPAYDGWEAWNAIMERRLKNHEDFRTPSRHTK